VFASSRTKSWCVKVVIIKNKKLELYTSDSFSFKKVRFACLVFNFNRVTKMVSSVKAVMKIAGQILENSNSMISPFLIYTNKTLFCVAKPTKTRCPSAHPVKLYHLFTVHLLQRDFRHEFMHILDLIFNGVVDGEHKANMEISRFYHRDAFSLGKLAYRTYDACKLTG